MINEPSLLREEEDTVSNEEQIEAEEPLKPVPVTDSVVDFAASQVIETIEKVSASQEIETIEKVTDLEPPEDFQIRIEINKEDLKHVLSREHRRDMSLLFYDFNNSSLRQRNLANFPIKEEDEMIENIRKLKKASS